jgi:hypothetical protein
MTESTGKHDLDEFLYYLQVTQETAMECLSQARLQQSRYYNKRKRESPIYQVGEEVLLLRKFIQSRCLNSKLDY